MPGLDFVPANHVWTKTDVLNAQNTLKAICSTATFSPIPDLWKQGIIDEINAVIASGCKDCAKPPPPPPPPKYSWCWAGYEVTMYYYVGAPPTVVKLIASGSGGSANEVQVESQDFLDHFRMQLIKDASGQVIGQISATAAYGRCNSDGTLQI